MMEQVGDQVLSQCSKTFEKRAQAMATPASQAQTASVAIPVASDTVGGTGFSIRVFLGYIKNFFVRR